MVKYSQTVLDFRRQMERYRHHCNIIFDDGEAMVETKKQSEEYIGIVSREDDGIPSSDMVMVYIFWE